MQLLHLAHQHAHPNERQTTATEAWLCFLLCVVCVVCVWCVCGVCVVCVWCVWCVCVWCVVRVWCVCVCLPCIKRWSTYLMRAPICANRLDNTCDKHAGRRCGLHPPAHVPRDAVFAASVSAVNPKLLISRLLRKAAVAGTSAIGTIVSAAWSVQRWSAPPTRRRCHV